MDRRHFLKNVIGGGIVAGSTMAFGGYAQLLAATVEVMGLFEGAFDPALDAAQWGSMASFLEQHKLVAKPVAAADAFTNDYAG